MTGELINGVRVVTAPRVRLMTTQAVDWQSLAEFLLEEADAGDFVGDAATDADLIPELAGRVCYMSFQKPRPGGNRAYLGHIKEVGHGSVLEHTAFGLLVSGVSRCLSHELVRHRAGMAYSQLSQRYVDSSAVAFVVHPADVKDYADYKAWSAAANANQPGLMDHPALEGYERFVRWLGLRLMDLKEYEARADQGMAAAPAGLSGTERRKWARQAARGCLPGEAETKVFVTGNARAWRHFIEMRASRHADAEIRRLAVAVLKVLTPAAPALFGDYTLSTLPDGTQEADTPHRKV